MAPHPGDTWGTMPARMRFFQRPREPIAAGAEIVIAGPATVEAIETGLACAARGGTVVQFMGTEARLSLPTFDVYFRELRLVPSYSCGPRETRAALGLTAAGVVRAPHVVPHRFDWAPAAEASESPLKTDRRSRRWWSSRAEGVSSGPRRARERGTDVEPDSTGNRGDPTGSPLLHRQVSPYFRIFLAKMASAFAAAASAR
jgi:hypothetical protein